MHKHSKKLSRKIRTCAGLTGSGTLVAAASLGLVSKVNGAMVTLQLDDHISPKSQLSYDIDGDGDLDVSFQTGTIDTVTGVSMKAEFLMTGGCTFGICGSIIRYDSLGFSFVQSHTGGEMISSSGSGCYYPGSDPSWLTIGSGGPFFEPTSPRYAGFSFVQSLGLDTLVYNAWAELEVTEPQPGVYDLDVIAIGYESEPFTPVPAGGIISAVQGNTPSASGLSLRNTPNPFNNQTQIEFDLPQGGTASIRIYDAAGRLVRTMRHTRGQKGLNFVTWDASDDAGSRVPSGVYFCRLEAFGKVRTHKLIVIE